jgi:kumamolisin
VESSHLFLQSDNTMTDGETLLGLPLPDAPVRLVVKVRAPESPATLATTLGLLPPLERPRISDREYAARYGARETEIAAVVRYFRARRLEPVYSEAVARIVVVTGTVRRVEAVFGVRLVLVRTRDGEVYRTFTGPLSVPEPLREIITTVVGFDDRPVGKRATNQCPTGTSPLPIPEVARLYNFPSDLNGTGQRIAFLEFGGGFSQADFTAYFTDLGVVAPPVTVVPVGGGSNDPKGNASREVMLDVEVAGAIAPGAELTVYAGLDSMAGWLETLTCAVHASPRPSVISISWVKNEFEADKLTLPCSMVDEINLILAEAAALNITVTAATGDSGSSAGVNDGKPHVSIFASSPYALGCGGTTIQLTDDATEIKSETVWNVSASCTTGGGVSEYFPKQPWQAAANVPTVPGTGFAGRGVPDVAAAADHVPGYRIYALGQFMTSGGTSASAPLWAGLIALVNQRLDQLSAGAAAGYIVPFLYCGVGLTDAFNDVQTGKNGFHFASPGWDPCTGWGTPNGVELLRALTGGQ